ncbi:thioredoxin-disulfide reductase [Oleidesulfovibrio alaskensis]|jgi:thioredoxin reductase (NADPH)|uniref:thioredoxin-disulfide reductase n=1 Tax=Oleidesulfovibrio alaskensis TaxID=58180 RepID=UPI001A5E0F18|nr:thioredoxin-disulfide reductase [Oleidesulfovibrio alaskensis]MBL3582738.1 thioredoxin-disulfide reductase [Oleidesulfovibrio alaskensis]
MKLYDSIVIGGGPAGMTAALYLLRSGVSVAWCEKLSPGGQMLMTEEIENYPGFPKGLKGYELVDLFAAHLDGWSFDKYTDEVAEIIPGNGVHRVRVGDEWVEGKTLIICSGARYKRLGLPNEERLTGKGISYCALCDGNFFRGQEVGVVGGGNSALEESLYLSKLVKKLHLIHRRDDFRAMKCYQDKVCIKPDIEVVRSTVVTEIHGENALDGVTLRNLKTGEEHFLKLDGLFVFIGFEPVTGFFPDQLGVDAQGFIITDVEMATNVPGIFAAGDVRSKLCRQVTTAVGDGATAANSAFLYLEQLDA